MCQITKKTVIDYISDSYLIFGSIDKSSKRSKLGEIPQKNGGIYTRELIGWSERIKVKG